MGFLFFSIFQRRERGVRFNSRGFDDERRKGEIGAIAPLENGN